MANMSYCRFENTALDLADCLENWEDEDLSDTEEAGKEGIIELAKELLEFEGYTITKEE